MLVFGSLTELHSEDSSETRKILEVADIQDLM